MLFFLIIINQLPTIIQRLLTIATLHFAIITIFINIYKYNFNLRMIFFLFFQNNIHKILSCFFPITFIYKTHFN
jgi:hypothetical protein